MDQLIIYQIYIDFHHVNSNRSVIIGRDVFIEIFQQKLFVSVEFNSRKPNKID